MLSELISDKAQLLVKIDEMKNQADNLKLQIIETENKFKR